MMKKLLKTALLCALSLPLSTLNAGLGYYAGRMAQGLTRGALVGIPVLGTGINTFLYTKNDKNGQLHFDRVIEFQSNLPQLMQNDSSLLQLIKAQKQQDESIFRRAEDSKTPGMTHESEKAIAEWIDMERAVEKRIETYEAVIANGPAREKLKMELSKKIAIPLENIAIDDFTIDNTDGQSSDSVLIRSFKKPDGTLAAVLATGKETLKKYENDPANIAVLLDHETAHITHGHSEKRTYFTLGSALTMTGIATFLATRKVNPRNLKPLQLFARSLTNMGKLAGLSFASNIAAGQLMQYQEHEADATALQKTTSIEEIKHFRDFMEDGKEHHAKHVSNPISQLFCTHPTPASRIAKIDARIQELQAQKDALETK